VQDEELNWGIASTSQNKAAQNKNDRKSHRDASLKEMKSKKT
jgi:hypothetical protein